MSQLRLLAPALLASAIALPLAAQSAPAINPAPLATTLAPPSVFTFAPSPSPTLNTQPPRTFILRVPRNPPTTTFTELQLPLAKDTAQVGRIYRVRPSLLAQTNQPCLKLRTYNFTARDLKSNHPQASSETDCTPASKVHLATAAPANLSPVALPATAEPR